MRARALLPLLVALAIAPAPAGAQQPPRVRLAAPSDCLTNAGCGAGLKRVYKLNVAGSFAPLAVADAGISSLDDGVGEVAIAFSSDPDLGRADIVQLRDDKHMIGSDHVVPVIRRRTVARLGRGVRRALDAASALLSSSALRGLNQQVLDGRLAEAVGAEFSDANGLGASRRARKRGRLVVGYMAFDEDEVLAWYYAEALRGAGYSVRVRAIGGLRPEAVKAVLSGKIDVYPGYSRSLTDYLTHKQVLTPDVRPELSRALAKVGAVAARPAAATDQNVFVTKRETADALGLAKISDLARFWPAVG